MKSVLVKIFGFPATLIHGDTLVLDRWLWLTKRLARTSSPKKLIDVGCGTGAFTIGAALRGYEALGLSWDERNQAVAKERAILSHAAAAKFEVLDIRELDKRVDLNQEFDVAICLEAIEHIINDSKLMKDIANCLKPGGKLLLTTPYFNYQPITPEDAGPFSEVENGWHVRKGYLEEELKRLCSQSGLIFEDCSYCSGYLSQKITFIFRVGCKISPFVGWLSILPLRILPPLLDPLIDKILQWPSYSICLEAHKPEA